MQHHKEGLDKLRVADPQYLRSLAAAPLSGGFFQIRTEHMFAAPEHVFHMASSIQAIYNEMLLPVEERAGPPVISEASSMTGAPQLSSDDLALKSCCNATVTQNILM